MKINDQAEPKLFISYSWTTSKHEAWVVRLAEELMNNQGIEVILDKWHLKPGQDANVFMEKMVTDPSVTKVLLICDAMYVQKSNGRKGGAGTEAQIITPELYANALQEKFAAVVVERDENGHPYLPVYYRGRIYFDLTDIASYSSEVEKIVRWAWERPLFVPPVKGARPSFLDQPVEQGKITSSLFHHRALEALRSGSVTAVPALREYLNTVLAGLNDFRIKVNSATSENFDDVVIQSIEKFIPYRNEIVEIFAVVAQYKPDSDVLNVLHRFFEGWIPYLNFQDTGTYSEYDCDNYRFLAHEIFLYCIGVFIRYEQFEAAATFVNEEYYGVDVDRRKKMLSFLALYEHTRSLSMRNDRLKLKSFPVRADIIKSRNVSTGLDFSYIMAADFILYIHSQRIDSLRRWWPETLVFAGRYSGPLEMFARAKSSRYFERIKPLLGVATAEEFRILINSIANSVRLPKWDFDTLDPVRLTAIENIGKAP